MIADQPSLAPTPPAKPHHHEHGHDHAGARHPAPSRPPLTLLTCGLGYRLGAAAVLLALLWGVVRWALM